MLTLNVITPGSYRIGANFSYRFVPDPTYSQLMSYLSMKENVSPRIDLTALVGYPSQSENLHYRILGDKPVTGLIGRNGQLDKLNTFVSNTKALFTGWNFVSTTVPSLLNENSINHRNIVGKLVAGDNELSLLRDEEEWPASNQRIYMLTLRGNISQPYLDPYLQADYGPISGFLYRCLPELQTAVNNGSFDYWVGNIHYLHSGFQYHLSNRYFCDYIGFYWGYEVDNGSTVTYQRWWITMRWQIGFHPSVLSFGDSFWLINVVDFNWRYYISSVAEATAPSGQSVAHPLPPKEEFLQMSYNLPPYLSSETLDTDILDTIGYRHDLDRLSSQSEGGSGDYSFRNFQNIVGGYQGDCYMANFFSTKDAVERQFDYLAANNLENLSQIGDMMGLVSSIQLLLDVSKMVLYKDFSFIKIIRLLSNAYLTFKFGIAPSMKDAHELASKASHLLESLDFGPFDSRGIFHYDGIDDFTPFLSSYLRAHSKVVATIPSDYYLPMVMPFDKIGLLPSLSRVWAVLPYSFLVDWAFNIEGQLDVIDTMVKFSFVEPSYLVHSVSVIWPFTNEFLSNHNVTSEGSPEADVVGYKYYFRYISTVMPSPTPSRLGFLSPSGVTDWFSAGSLLIQRLR